MATTYSEVYEFFLSKISDYSFLNLTQTELEDDLIIPLRSAITKFRNCRIDLKDRDDNLMVFNKDLSDDEKDVLATLLVVEFLKPEVVNSKNYKQTMSDSDFKAYSQANHIKELVGLYKEMKSEASKMITDYSYRSRDLRKIGDET